MSNEFENDLVFARYIRYMEKALLHKRIDYLRHQEYLNRKERLMLEEEWVVLSCEDNATHSFFDSNSRTLPVKGERVEKALKKLTEKQRKIIISFYYKKKPIKIIATELNCTENAIKLTKQRAIKKLKEFMEVNNESQN